MLNVKTINIAPSWETALNICLIALDRSNDDIRSARGKAVFKARMEALLETFLPLCRATDARNAEIRAEQEAKAAKTPTVCPECADTLPCGHAEIDEEARCAICGGEGL
jgi:hypothetical protein